MNRRMADSSDSKQPAGDRPRWQFGLGDMLLGVAVVAVYLAAYVLVFRGVTSRDVIRLAAFTAMVVVGTILGVYLPNPWMQRRAGAVVVRLRGRRPQGSWFVWTCLVPFAALLMVPLLNMTPDSSPFIRILWIVFVTQSACFAAWTLWRRSLAICERGIVTNGAAFTPWHKIRSVGYRLDEHGHLVIGRGLWRVVAFVPPEARETVETLLKEKLRRDGPVK